MHPPVGDEESVRGGLSEDLTGPGGRPGPVGVGRLPRRLWQRVDRPASIVTSHLEDPWRRLTLAVCAPRGMPAPARASTAAGGTTLAGARRARTAEG